MATTEPVSRSDDGQSSIAEQEHHRRVEELRELERAQMHWAPLHPATSDAVWFVPLLLTAWTCVAAIAPGLNRAAAVMLSTYLSMLVLWTPWIAERQRGREADAPPSNGSRAVADQESAATAHAAGATRCELSRTCMAPIGETPLEWPRRSIHTRVVRRDVAASPPACVVVSFKRAMNESTTEPRSPTPADIRALLDAERTGMAFLQWRSGDGAQQILILGPERQRVTIGRTTDSDVVLSWDLEVSRTHALLEVVGDAWTVIDDGLSRNGSFINGGRVLGRQRLHNRDRMVFGRTQIVFRDTDRGEGEASTARANDGSGFVPLTERQRKILIALCRPINDDPSAIPATNQQIADELYLGVDAVKAHLRVLFERFGFESLPQNQKRSRLAHRALADGIVNPRDF